MADLRGYVEGLIGFEGDGTNVVANPAGTPTDNLETIQIGDAIYNVGGGGEEIVPTPTTVDRGKYLRVKSNANELEYININELPSSERANAGDVLTHTINGDSWLPPAKELPTYNSGDNGKVLGVSSGALAWVEQSGGGGGVSYSTDEQDTGLTWIDGSPIYQKTIVLTNLSLQSGSNNFTLSSFNIYDVKYVIEEPTGFLKVSESDIRTYPFGSSYSLRIYATPTNLVIERTGTNISLAELTTTIRYIKNV